MWCDGWFFAGTGNGIHAGKQYFCGFIISAAYFNCDSDIFRIISVPYDWSWGYQTYVVDLWVHGNVFRSTGADIQFFIGISDFSIQVIVFQKLNKAS